MYECIGNLAPKFRSVGSLVLGEFVNALSRCSLGGDAMQRYHMKRRALDVGVVAQVR